ncbi:MAG: winged helix-turn-helix transcriptional regulator [Phycisphaerales bacterium]|nr:winged helix-turn-helix transcriptional regulator [Phycisphaerales bacterium]
MVDIAMNACAATLHVLSDQTRLEVVRLLLDGSQRVKDINDVLGIEQSLLSHHLRVLREAGVVETERDGKCIVYRLSQHMVAKRRGRSLDFGCCTLSFES